MNYARPFKGDKWKKHVQKDILELDISLEYMESHRGLPYQFNWSFMFSILAKLGEVKIKTLGWVGYDWRTGVDNHGKVRESITTLAKVVNMTAQE